MFPMRMSFAFLITVFAVVGSASIVASKYTNLTNGRNCMTLPMAEDEIELLPKLFRKLDSFLTVNVELGWQSLQKALWSSGYSKNGPLVVDKNDPLETTLLLHQLLMHNEMKDSIAELKKLLHTKGFPSNKEGKNSVKSGLMTVTPQPMKDGGGGEPYASTDHSFRPADCSELLVSGHTNSGVYNIYPFSCRCTKPVLAYCDMDTDGGGWTVFLHRSNSSKPINFTRNWDKYKNGFGKPDEEFWLGNEALHTLTFNRNYVLRMEANDGYGREIWGEWDSVVVHPEELKYKLSISKFNPKSTAFDRFSYHNEMTFSTYDEDSDKNAKSCAEVHKGGWWFNTCTHINPTGVHGKQDQVEGISFNPWSKLDPKIRYAHWLHLKLRPKVCSNSISVVRLNTHNCNIN